MGFELNGNKEETYRAIFGGWSVQDVKTQGNQASVQLRRCKLRLVRKKHYCNHLFDRWSLKLRALVN